MKVFGRNVRFMRTVAANCKIADMCPNGDLKNIGKLLEGNFQKSQRSAAKFMAVLSEGYEQNRHFTDPEYEMHPLSEDEALCLSDDDFAALFTEAIEAYAGEKPTVETEPVKKTAKKAASK